MALTVTVSLCLLPTTLLAVTSATLDLFDFDYGRAWDDIGDSSFHVYWNMPTFQCRKFAINFTSVSDQWGMRQNYRDDFRGDAVALLYDPGLFPALLTTTVGGTPELRNGGVPQAGNLSLHLDRFRRDLTVLIPATTFRGIAVIDFEHWRPIWRQNWLSLSVYKDYSQHMVRKKFPWWSAREVEKEATERFQAAAKVFMLETLRLAKAMRPRALWGYYGYPLCFNYKPVGNSMPCSMETRRDNDGMKWLFKESTALFPSVYLSSKELRNNKEFIIGRVDEAVRLSKASSKRSPVYVYTWPKYRDANRFLSKGDMNNSLIVPREQGAEGALIWGSTNDLNTRDKCLAVQDYVQSYLGPTAHRAMQEQPSTSISNFLQILGKR